MSFRFYTNAISQASRNFAAGLFIVGLLLIGFGFLVYILRELFAILAAIVFFVAGVGCAVTAVKIFWTLHKLDKTSPDDSDPYRKNVQIHIEHHDME
jgi:tellurite resistance protein TehA-like permease